MSDDPIKDLEDFNQQGLNVNPLPPSQVRRLGDRMRRRNAAFAAVGAAAAIAVIVTPLAVFAGGRDHAEPPVTTQSVSPSVSPSKSPSSPVATAIPDDFPIAAGLGEGVETSDNALVANRLTYCDERPLSSVEPLEALSAELSGGETSETRTLLLLDDERAAADAEQALLDAAADCTTEGDTAGGIEHEVIPESADWPGRTIQSTWGGDPYPTARFVHVVRAGPALLLTSSYAGGPADLEQTRDGVAPLVAAMAQFVGAEPGTDPSASEPTNTLEIPKDFPLADGLPDDGAEPGQPGLRGPNRTLEPLSLSACGSSLDEPPHVDQLRASWTNVEDYRDRQLTSFEDAAQAVTYVQGLTDFYRSCPEEDGGQAGSTIVHEVSRTAVGGESWAVVTYYEFDGAPAVGLTVVHVIRLGRAVLIDTTSNEGSGPGRSAQIREQTNAAVDVVSAMCLFTESGC